MSLGLYALGCFKLKPEITLSPSERGQAGVLGKKMDQAVGFDYRNDPNGVGVSDRYIFGMFGETAFAKFLTNLGIRFEWNPQATGRSDNGDFVVYFRGSPVVIDVKTGRYYRNSILLTEREYAKCPDSWRFVFVREKERQSNTYVIEGVCRKCDLERVVITDGTVRYEKIVSELQHPAVISSHCDRG